MKIEGVIENVQIPARSVNAPGRVSAIKQALEALEVGSGLTYVVTGKSQNGVTKKPEIRNQYVHIDKNYWFPKEKAFKVFIAQNQEGLAEDETRFTIARVPFDPAHAPKKRTTAVQAADEARTDAGSADYAE